MISLLCFDLDGTICSTKELHRDSLNIALQKLAPEYVISNDDHLTTFDGLPTLTKLDILHIRGLPESLRDSINTLKQHETQRLMGEMTFTPEYGDIFAHLKTQGYMVAICTNSIRSSTDIMLDKIGVTNYVDFVLTNEDVRHPKPHPDMYTTAMQLAHVTPAQTLIFEDSPRGIAAATTSGAYVRVVSSHWELTTRAIIESIDYIHAHEKMRILRVYDHTLQFT